MDFFELLVGVETELWNRLEKDLLEAGQVGLGTLLALRVLNRRGEDVRVQDLSDDLSITVGAASKLVDRLERDGLANRRPHPEDRRSSLISLTASGHLERELSERLAREKLNELLDDEAEFLDLIPVLERLRGRLGAAAARASA